MEIYCKKGKVLKETVGFLLGRDLKGTVGSLNRRG